MTLIIKEVIDPADRWCDLCDKLPGPRATVYFIRDDRYMKPAGRLPLAGNIQLCKGHARNIVKDLGIQWDREGRKKS